MYQRARRGAQISLEISLEGRSGGAAEHPGLPAWGIEASYVRLRAVGRSQAGTMQNSLAALWPSRSWIGMKGSATATSPATVAEDRLLRPEQAAWYLNVKTSWVYDAVRTGRLPCHRVGRHIRFTRPMLDDWLAEQPRH